MSAEEALKWGNKAKPGMPLFEGPSEVREAFIVARGIDWTASYIDPAIWIGQSRAIVPRTDVAFDRIQQQASFICQKIGVVVRKPSAAMRMAAE